MITYQILSAFPFFGKFSSESRRLVESQGEMRIFPRGASVIRKGDRVGGMYLVVAGRLRVFTMSSGGDEASLYSVDRGESCLLATSALFAEMLYPAWVEVETKEAKIFCVPRGTFRMLYEAEPALRDFTVNILSGRVFDLMTALEERNLRSIEDRLKDFLLRRVNEHGEVETTHQQIALSLGTVREVVSRKLRRFSREGLIKTHRGRIKMLKPQALA